MFMYKKTRVDLAWLVTCFALIFSPVQLRSIAQQHTAIPIDRLGAVAGREYQGDGLSISTITNGAVLRCVFQQLEGEATTEGLWLRSTGEGADGNRFRVVATRVGRGHVSGTSDIWAATDFFNWSQPTLPSVGAVSVADKVVKFVRDFVTEEYSLSMDGVRQDFVISQPPAGDGELRVELAVIGAKAAPLANVNGVRLVLNESGRKLAYHRLRVTDARGRILTARMEVVATGNLAVVVDDAQAVFPVRIDPTFSDDDWIGLSGAPGTIGEVLALAGDGLGNLYVGGTIDVAGTVVANRIAKWDGSAWSNLGSGMDGPVYALVVSGGELYAGGSFTTAGGVPAANVAKWNGTAWSAVGSGVNDAVRALTIAGADLYVAGDFTTAGGNPASRVARWNGISWSPLGAGLDGPARALAILGSDVYVGGDFLTAGGNPAANIAKWNGSIWSSVGSGMDGNVWALAVSGSTLYAGGEFATAGGNAAAYAAAWNGSSWSALGAGMSGVVYALAISGSDVYAGGYFYDGIGGPGNYVARWNGSSWSALGTGLNAPVKSIAALGGDIITGGAFGTAGSTVAAGIASWNGSSWSALSAGFNGQVIGMAIAPNGDLYVAGAFTSTPDSGTNYVVRWDGAVWRALGSGLNNWARAVAIIDTNVYVGGDFTVAGGIPALYIARWNGSTWSAVGGGMNNPVHCLVASGTNLYAGGQFTLAINGGGGGVVLVNGVARWNGSAWSAMGLGLSAPSRVLATDNSQNVYVGGDFVKAYNTGGGAVTVNYVAKWNGTAWSPLGQGVNNAVYALAVSGTNVYVGGTFGQAINSNGTPVSARIVRYDGFTWSTLGAGTDDNVYAMVASGDNLYAAGQFYAAGGNPANRIAKWDGSTWSPLGSGITAGGFPSALALSGTDLYVGGDFTQAGGKVAINIAKAVVGIRPGRFTNVLYSPVTGLSATFLEASVGKPYRIQSSPSLSPPNWTDFTNFTYSGPIVFTDATVVNGTNKFFRAVTP